MRGILVSLIFLVFVVGVSAHGEHEHSDLEQAEAIINAQIPCGELSDEQLEQVGDYYMEQMHPGEAHVSMDEAMGENIKGMHIRMAEHMYCGQMPVEQYRPSFWHQLSWVIWGALAAFVLGLTFWGAKRVYKK